MNVFGPVPSRRLGISLGVNNIPHKVCSYSCLYCQIGKAVRIQGNRQEFYKPDELYNEVSESLNRISDNTKYPDYITIVPDGEPTLDVNLGDLITLLKTTGLPVAVITNSSILYQADVKECLCKADYVSLKVDTVNENTFNKINRPHKKLELHRILKGIQDFSEIYKGIITSETMLLKGINDSDKEIKEIASYLETIQPSVAYLAIPTRPPAFEHAISVDEVGINNAFQLFKDHLNQVELLTGYEGNAFASTGNPVDDILSITSVHPMREDAVFEILKKHGKNSDTIQKMVNNGLINKLKYQKHYYYIRNFQKQRKLFNSNKKSINHEQ